MTKKNLISSLFVFSFFVPLALSFPGSAVAQGSLEGAWLRTQTDDADGNVDSEPLPGFWLFTVNHYSMMIVTGNKPRALEDAENPSDAQILAAYRSITANSGRYEVEDNQVILHPYVAKSPNFMAGWPETTISFSFVRDGDTLTLTSNDGGMTTFENVDNSAPPWD